MISCKSYRSAWIRLLLCCLQRLTWIPISEHHHGSQIRVRVTSVIFIELLKFFSVNQKCKREIFSSLCCFLVCLFHKWHQAWLNSILLQIYICFNKHAYFSKNEQNFERNKFENLVYPEINLDSDFTSGEDKHLRYTTCAVRPPGQKSGLRDWKCHRLIKYISSYIRLTFLLLLFSWPQDSKSLLQNDSLRRERMGGA